MTIAPNSFDRPLASNIAKQDVPFCPVCTSERRRPLFWVEEHEYTTTTSDRFPMKACEECGAWYLDPRPHTSTLGIIYPPNYYIHVVEPQAKGSVEQQRKGMIGRLMGHFMKLRFRPVARHLELSPTTRYLDIGCGNGAMLQAMKEAYGMVGTGIDLSESAVRMCRDRGFVAHVSRFEDYQPDRGETYDLLFSSHLIEHVESPLEYMKKAHRLLRPGGLNVFTTPNKRTWEVRLFGKYWGGLHVPRHWSILDPRSASILGRKSGFEYLETHCSTNGTFWTWSFHSSLVGLLGRPICDRIFPSDHRFMESNLWNLLRGGLFTGMDAFNVLMSGRSGNMTVIYRKPDGAPRAE